ncbi:MAG: phosphate acyltransferase PlsX [Halomonas sp.]|nr:phosphate acyltransferase PlsX [Halomonas sp.]TVP50918.1 MAG: phosphate acyltransferase PlsX [Halomonas sp.]
MRLAIDVMGGDQGPHAIVAGSARAVVEHPALELILFGPRQQILAEISRLPQPLAAAASRLAARDAPESVAPSATAAWALRRGRDTSMSHMLRSVAQGEAVAGVSAGNTAALVAMARRELGMIEGISRPAISTAIPARGGRRCYLLDLGANVDSPAHRLVDFALMGVAMAQCVDGTVKPRVALLNVGAEATKGSASVREADRQLREYPTSDAFIYQGYAEGGDLFKGQLDVVVCDGFVGNAVLKASEGLTSMLVERVQMAFESRLSGRLASLLAKPVLRRLKQELDPVRYNGASLLGLRGIVVKSHGSTHADGFYYAIERALKEVEHNLPARIAGRWQAPSF